MKALSSVLLLGLTSCNLYEGRSLDLFPSGDVVLVECREASDCARDRPFCERGSCVACLLDSDCDRRHPACVGNTCVECRSAEDCGPGQGCNSALDTCAPACSQVLDCPGPAMTRCSPELGVCVQCAADADCREPKKPVCGHGGRCVECRETESCALDAGPREPTPLSIADAMPPAPLPALPSPTPPAPAP